MQPGDIGIRLFGLLKAKSEAEAEEQVKLKPRLGVSAV